MNGDARNVLNQKRKRQMQTGRRFQQRNQTINDARQVLIQKKLQGVQKAKFNRAMQGGRNYINPRNSSNKPQFRSQANNRNFANSNSNGRQPNANRRFTQNTAGRPFNQINRTQNPNKRVQFARNGALKIISKNRNQNHMVPNIVNRNRFVTGMSDLTVVARNKQLMFQLDSEMFDEPVDNGDELESMTLEDIPEINNMKDLPVSFLTQKKPTPWQTASSSSNSTLFSRLAKTVGSSTMIADTVSPPQCYNNHDWKLLVTNLKPSVSQSDVTELFGYVGNLKSADLVQPGTALIIYHSKEDALKAFESYNDRLLDGAPMHCIFPQNPTSARTPITARLGGKFNSNLNTMSSRASGSSLSSRRVAFTVKLP